MDIVGRLKFKFKLFAGRIVNNEREQIWYKHGQMHRDKGPAYISAVGTRKWYWYDKLHRTDGPAIEWQDGGREWFIKDKRHREDGPAVEKADGHQEWWQNNALHRDDGPAVIDPEAGCLWYLNGKPWEEGPEITGKIQAARHEQQIEDAVKGVTKVDQDIAPVKPIRFKKRPRIKPSP